MRAEAVSWDDWSVSNPASDGRRRQVARPTRQPDEVKIVSLEQFDDLFRLSIVDSETQVWQSGMADVAAAASDRGLGRRARSATQAWSAEAADARRVSVRPSRATACACGHAVRASRSASAALGAAFSAATRPSRPPHSTQNRLWLRPPAIVPQPHTRRRSRLQPRCPQLTACAHW